MVVVRKLASESPKKLANLIDITNISSDTLRDFVGKTQTSCLGCFITVWKYIKANNLQDQSNKNIVNCDDKLKSILLGKPQVELAELPMLVKLHFPKKTNCHTIRRPRHYPTYKARIFGYDKTPRVQY